MWHASNFTWTENEKECQMNILIAGFVGSGIFIIVSGQYSFRERTDFKEARNQRG